MAKVKFFISLQSLWCGFHVEFYTLNATTDLAVYIVIPSLHDKGWDLFHRIERSVLHMHQVNPCGGKKLDVHIVYFTGRTESKCTLSVLFPDKRRGI